MEKKIEKNNFIKFKKNYKIFHKIKSHMRKSDESDESHNSYKYVKKSRIRKSDESDAKQRNRKRVREEKKDDLFNGLIKWLHYMFNNL